MYGMSIFTVRSRKRFHELVVLELLVLGLVGVADDDLVDVGLRELLRLDLVLLRRAEQVVEERDVELQHFDELDDAAVGDVELAVEVEGARVGVGAVLGDLAVVDVAGELGRVLVLLVLRLEGADADAVLLGEDQAAHRMWLDHLARSRRSYCVIRSLKTKRQAGQSSPLDGIACSRSFDERRARR